MYVKRFYARGITPSKMQQSDLAGKFEPTAEMLANDIQRELDKRGGEDGEKLIACIPVVIEGNTKEVLMIWD